MCGIKVDLFQYELILFALIWVEPKGIKLNAYQREDTYRIPHSSILHSFTRQENGKYQVMENP